jgi:ankyrin repeat protein
MDFDPVIDGMIVQAPSTAAGQRYLLANRYLEAAMQNESPPHLPELDEETIAFAQRIFHYTRAGYAQELAQLLDQGLPANLLNEKGDSLLMLACYHGHSEVAELLLRHGGDPELANDRGQTPLAGGAFKGDAQIVRLLLKHGANVNGSGPDGRTALMVAAMFNRTEIVDLLLVHGADIHARDAQGLTAEAAARMMEAPDTPEQLARFAKSNASR